MDTRTRKRDVHNRNRSCSRYLISWLLTLTILVGTLVPAQVQAAKLPVPVGLHDHHAFTAIDAWSGQELMGEDATKKVYPASTVKLMTAIVMLEAAKDKGISLNKKVKITQKLLNQVELGLASYHMQVGESYTLRTLMNMMLISSYGDATYAAAVTIFGSVANCVKAMNAKAKAMGLKNTSFDNVVGLDVGNNYKKTYTTAAEMGKITRLAMQNDTICGIVAKAKFQVIQADGTKGRVIESSNLLYSKVPYDKNLFTIVGSKTGTTRAAGNVFAGTAVDKAGHKVISVYMGKDSSEARFSDTNLILRAIFQAVKDGVIPLRTENTYPIYLKGNGSTEGSMTWATFTYDKEKKLPKNLYKRTGYTFNGWNTKKDGSGIGFAGRGIVKNLISRTKAYGTLYAQWKIREYKIAYHLDGGENALHNPSTYTVKNKITLADPIREGYNFLGWYTRPECDEESRITKIAKGTTGKIYLYANWEEIPVDVEEPVIVEPEIPGVETKEEIPVVPEILDSPEVETNRIPDSIESEEDMGILISVRE